MFDVSHISQHWYMNAQFSLLCNAACAIVFACVQQDTSLVEFCIRPASACVCFKFRPSAPGPSCPDTCSSRGCLPGGTRHCSVNGGSDQTQPTHLPTSVRETLLGHSSSGRSPPGVSSRSSSRPALSQESADGGEGIASSQPLTADNFLFDFPFTEEHLDAMLPGFPNFHMYQYAPPLKQSPTDSSFFVNRTINGRRTYVADIPAEDRSWTLAKVIVVLMGYPFPCVARPTIVCDAGDFGSFASLIAPTFAFLLGDPLICTTYNSYRAFQAQLAHDDLERHRRLASSVSFSFANQIMHHHLLSDVGTGQAPAQECDSSADKCVIDKPVPSSANIKKPKTVPKLIAVTFNANSWSSLKAFLKCTKANIVFGQEHKLPRAGTLEATIQALKLGWCSYWSPANVSSVNGKSGGTVVLVRSYIQSWIPAGLSQTDMEVWPSRGNAVVVAAGDMGPVLCVSCYFHTNPHAKSKVVPLNMKLLGALGTCIKNFGFPALLGADWHMTPSTLRSISFLNDFHLSLQHDPSCIGSCITHGGAVVSTIDFFAVS